jgi:hypothetical protein
MGLPEVLILHQSKDQYDLQNQMHQHHVGKYDAKISIISIQTIDIKLLLLHH